MTKMRRNVWMNEKTSVPLQPFLTTTPISLKKGEAKEKFIY